MNTPSPSTPAIHAVDLSLVYPGTSKPALQEINFSFDAGQIAALLGHSGAGKTTLLRLVSGQIEPTSGQIRINGETSGEQTGFTKTVQFSDASPLLEAGLSVSDHLNRLEAAPADTCQVMSLLGLESFSLSLVEALPQTMRNRLALACALLQPPGGECTPGGAKHSENNLGGQCSVSSRMLRPYDLDALPIQILDDLPGLDLRTAEALQDWLPDWIHAQERTLVFSTRCPRAAAALADQVLVLRRGRLVSVHMNSHPSPAAPDTGYQIRINGRLDANRSAWFPGLKLECDGADTLLSGALPDQAALLGLLARIRDLGIPIQSVQRLAPGWVDILEKEMGTEGEV